MNYTDWAEGLGLVFLTIFLATREWRRLAQSKNIASERLALEASEQKLSLDLNQAHQDKAALTEAVQLAQAVVKKLESNVQTSNCKIQTLESEATKRRGETLALEATLEGKSLEWQQKEQEWSLKLRTSEQDSEAQISRLEATLEHKSAELDSQIQALDALAEQVQTQGADHAAVLGCKDEVIEQLNHDLHEIRGQQQSLVASLNTDFQVAEGQFKLELAQVESEKAELEQKYLVIDAERDRLTQQFSEITSENVQLVQQVSEIGIERDLIIEKCNQLEGDLRQALTHQNSLEAQIQGFDEERQTYIQEIANLKINYESVIAHQAEFTDLIQTHSLLSVEYEAVLRDQRESLQQLEAERENSAAIAQSLKSLEATTEDQTCKIHKLQQVRQGLEQDLNSKTLKIKEFEAKLQTSQKNIDRVLALEEELKAIRTELNQQNEIIFALTEENQSLKLAGDHQGIDNGTIEQREIQIQALEQELAEAMESLKLYDALQQTNRELENTLQDAQFELEQMSRLEAQKQSLEQALKLSQADSEKLVQQSQEFENLNTLNVEQFKTIQGLEAELAQAQAQAKLDRVDASPSELEETLQRECDRLQESLDQALETNSQIEAEFQAQIKILGQDQQQQDTLVRELNEAQTQIESIELQLAQSQSIQEELTQTIDTLAASFAQAKSESIPKEENEALLEERDRLLGQVNGLEQSKASLEEANETLQAQLTSLEQVTLQQEMLTQDLSAAQAQQASIESELAETKAHNQILAQTIQSLESSFAQVESGSVSKVVHEATLEECDRLSNQIENLEQAKAALEAANDFLQPDAKTPEDEQQLIDLSAELEATKSQLKSMAAELAQSQTQRQDLTQTIESLEASLAQVQSESISSESISNDDNESNDDNDALVEECDRLLTQLESLEAEKSSLEARATRLDSEIQSLTQEAKATQALRDAKTRLETELEALRHQQTLTTAEINAAQDLQQALEVRNAELEQTIEAINTQQQTANKQVESLEQTLQTERDRHQQEIEEAGTIVQTLEEELQKAIAQSQNQSSSSNSAAPQIGAELLITNQDLEKQNQVLNQDKKKLQDAMKMAQEVVGSLQVQVKTLTQAKQTLEKELEISKTAIAPSPAEAPEIISTATPESTALIETVAAVVQGDNQGVLAGQAFVITGKFKQVGAEKVRSLIESEGGTINTHPSHKTNYIVVGENPGNKLQKAEKYGTPQLNEAELLELLHYQSE
jgi:hypothetical protein